MSESVQWALLAPMVLLTIVAVIQVAIWLHARQAVQHAAAAAAEAEAIHQPSSGAGQAAAEELTRVAGVHEVRVVVVGDREQVRVTVRGRVNSFLPWLDPYVSEQAIAVRERVER